MSSLYQSSVPLFKMMLTNLSDILKKAEHHAKQKKIDPSVLLHGRLFPDMLNLIKQVQIACDQAKNGMGRVSGINPPKFADKEKTFQDLYKRISNTIKYLNRIKPEDVNYEQDKVIKMSGGGKHFEFKGEQYVITWLIPNFFFHFMTTYSILRHNGIEIGKKDFFGMKYMQSVIRKSA